VVRFEQNEVLEELYKAVGIRTIYLDPQNRAKSAEERTKLLEAFMVDMAVVISDDGKMPGAENRMYMSAGLLDAIAKESPTRRVSAYGSSFQSLVSRTEIAYVRHAAYRVIPKEHAARVDEALRLTSRRPSPFTVVWLLGYFSQGYFGSGAGTAAMRMLLRDSTRTDLMESGNCPWEKIWATKLTVADAEGLLAALESELENHATGTVDADFAYAVDLVKRIQAGMIVSSNELEAKATDALKRAAKLYPSVEFVTTAADGPPKLDDLLSEIEAAVPPDTEQPDDDIPF
jgi:hypothetical protein